MKAKKLVRDYSTIAIGSAVMGNIGGIAGANAAPALGNAMAGMNIMAGGLTAKAGIGLMDDMKSLGKKRKSLI